MYSICSTARSYIPLVYLIETASATLTPHVEPLESSPLTAYAVTAVVAPPLILLTAIGSCLYCTFPKRAPPPPTESELKIIATFGDTLLHRFDKNLTVALEASHLLEQCYELGKQRPHFRSRLFDILQDANGTCRDRISLFLNTLYFHYCLESGTLPKGFSIRDIAVGMRRNELLLAAAYEANGHDPIQDYYVLQLRLRERLYLPLFTTHLELQAAHSLTDKAIEGIGEGIRIQTSNPAESAAQCEGWRDYLRHGPSCERLARYMQRGPTYDEYEQFWLDETERLFMS